MFDFFRLLTFVIIAAIQAFTLAPAISSNSQIEDRIKKFSTLRPELQALLSAYSQMEGLTTQNKWQDIISLEEENNQKFEDFFTKNKDFISTCYDFETLQYLRCASVSRAYSVMSESHTNRLDMLHMAKSYALKYLDNYDKIPTDDTEDSLSFMARRCHIRSLLAFFYARELETVINLNPTESRKDLIVKSEKLYIDAINGIELLSKYNKVKEIHIDAVRRSHSLKSELLEMYVSSMSHSNPHEYAYLPKALALFNEIKESITAEEKKYMAHVLDLCQISKKMLEANIKIANAKTQKIKKFLKENLDKLLEEQDRIQIQYRNRNSPDEVARPLEVFMDLIARFNIALRNNDSSSISAFKSEVDKLERSLCIYLKLNDDMSSEEKLPLIYAHLLKSLEGDKFEVSLNNIASYMALLSRVNEFEKALMHVDALIKAYKNLYGEECGPFRISHAICKLYNGDNTEWLELVKENLTKNKKKKDKKKAKREKERQLRLNAIKDGLANKEQNKLNNAPEPISINSNKASSVSKDKDDIEEFYNDPIPNPIVQKKEKQERHENAVAKRQLSKRADDASNTPNNVMIEVLPTPHNSNNEPAAEKPISLKETYQLTGLAAKVEDEIEKGTWNITREELETYFKAMGCIYKDGKGSHGKLQLPESVLLERNGVILSIFLKSGGALTLPSWDKGYIPAYLKKQISAVREKLKVLKRDL